MYIIFFLQFMTESHILWPKHLNAPQVWVSFEHYQQFGFTLVVKPFEGVMGKCSKLLYPVLLTPFTPKG